MSVEKLYLQYAGYFILLSVRIYRVKIRKYARKASLGFEDSKLDSIAERSRVMLLTLIGIDVFFYSLRAISHADKSKYIGLSTSMSIWLSLVTVTVMVADLAMMIQENKNSKFYHLRHQYRTSRFEVKAIEREAEQGLAAANGEPKKEISSTGDLTNPAQATVQQEAAINNGTLNKNDFLNPKRARKKFRLLIQHGKDEEDKYELTKTPYFGEIEHPSAEQFFGNGIKLHKLRTFHGRYYNMLSLTKLFVFEPIYVGLQMYPMSQIFVLALFQTSFAVYTAFIGFKAQVFSLKMTFMSILINETALSGFMIVGLIFQAAGGEINLTKSTADNLQFTAIGLICSACLVGLLEFITSMYASVKQYLINRKLQLHRDQRKKIQQERQEAQKYNQNVDLSEEINNNSQNHQLIEDQIPLETRGRPDNPKKIVRRYRTKKILQKRN